MRTTFLAIGLISSVLLQASTTTTDLQNMYKGKSTCIPELRSPAERYGIRLDRTQNAYLTAYRLKDANFLAIVQFNATDDKCGVIRDVVQSKDLRSSFVWNCVDPNEPRDVVVGTWSGQHKRLSGPALESWKVDLKQLTFQSISGHVSCRAGSYAGADSGDGLSDWAKKRTAK